MNRCRRLWLTIGNYVLPRLGLARLSDVRREMAEAREDAARRLDYELEVEALKTDHIMKKLVEVRPMTRRDPRSLVFRAQAEIDGNAFSLMPFDEDRGPALMEWVAERLARQVRDHVKRLRPCDFFNTTTEFAVREKRMPSFMIAQTQPDDRMGFRRATLADEREGS